MEDFVLGRQQSLHLRRNGEPTQMQSGQENLVFTLISGLGDDCVGCVGSPFGEFIGSVHVDWRRKLGMFIPKPFNGDSKGQEAY